MEVLNILRKQKKYLTYIAPLVAFQLLKFYSKTFYMGIIMGFILTVILEIVVIIQILKIKNKHCKISINDDLVSVQNFIVKQIQQEVPKKRQKYVNSFSKQSEIVNKPDLNIISEVIIENKQQANQNSNQWAQQNKYILKLNRKDFLKKVDLYQQLNEQIRETQSQHGNALSDFDGLSVIFNKNFELSLLNIVDNNWEHNLLVSELNDYSSDIFQKLTETNLEKNQMLILPPWKSFKIQLNRIGKIHLDLSKMLGQSISEQISLLKKEFNSEIDDLKKEKKKLQLEQTESISSLYLIKQQNDYNNVEKELKQQASLFADMNKKREDPSILIKQEMKVKLIMQNMDTMKQKLFDAKEKTKEVLVKNEKFNSKIQNMEDKWEEQRLVYLKQGLQNSLIGFEDLSQQIQQCLINLIIIVDQQSREVYYPKNFFKKSIPIIRPKTFLELVEEKCVESLDFISKGDFYLKYVDDTIQNWHQTLKYDEDIEYFIRELKYLYERHQSEFQFENKGIDVLWDTKVKGTAETIKISVKSIFQGICGLKEIYKTICQSLERNRTEVIKIKNDNISIGKELENCLIRDQKKLASLLKDYKMISIIHGDDKKIEQEEEKDKSPRTAENKESINLWNIQGEIRSADIKQEQKIQNKSKSKNIAEQFFNEVKSNTKNSNSISQFVAQVGQSVIKIHKMNNLSVKEQQERQEKILKESEPLFYLLGFTLNNVYEMIAKHHKNIAKAKKNILIELFIFAQNLSTHFRKTIDEMTLKINQEANTQAELKSTEQKLETIRMQDSIKLENSFKLEPTMKQEVPEDKILVPEYSLAIKKTNAERLLQAVDEKSDQIENQSNMVRQISKLVSVFFTEWKQNNYFKKKLSKILFKSFNKKRPSILSEIIIKDLKIELELTDIRDIIPQLQDEIEWLGDIEIYVKGQVLLILETKIIINWPRENYAQLPVTVNVMITSFNGKMRVCFVPMYAGKSWISFMGEPVINLQIDPILGQYSISNIPSISDIMKEFIVQKIKLLTYPNKCTIDVPISCPPKKLQQNIIQGEQKQQ